MFISEEDREKSDVIHPIVRITDGGRVQDWAEGVANQFVKFSDVPVEFREDVKKLLDKLLDPNALVLPVVMYNQTYKPD